MSYVQQPNPYAAPSMPAGAGHGMAGRGPARFSTEDLSELRRTATAAKVLGVCTIVTAAVNLLMNPAGIIGHVINIVFGALYLGGGKSMQKAADGEGEPIHNLIESLEKFGQIFMIQAILVMIALGIGLLVALFAGAMVFGTLR